MSSIICGTVFLLVSESRRYPGHLNVLTSTYLVVTEDHSQSLHLVLSACIPPK